MDLNTGYFMRIPNKYGFTGHENASIDTFLVNWDDLKCKYSCTMHLQQ